jgi:hypothetical protein
MRPLEQRARVEELRLEGLNWCEISRLTGIPRSTIRGWVVPWPKRYVRAAELRESCATCGHPRHDFVALSPRWYAYLLGMYLGDGTISRGRKGVYALRIFQDMRYTAVIAECENAMRVVLPSSRVSIQQRVGCVEIRSNSKAWPCLIPQAGPGRKHLRRIELTPWQQAIVDSAPESFVRGLLHSDGCRVINRVGGGYEYPRYFFGQVSDDIRRIFCSSLERLGIEYRMARRDNVSIARRASVARLDEFVGPKR